jgi:hypothetical protein
MVFGSPSVGGNVSRERGEALSLWAVVTTDPAAYVFAWMLGVVVGCTAVVGIDAVVTGRQPVEPWTEVATGVTLIVAVLYALLRSRAGQLTRLLEEGERVEAVLEELVDAAQWVHVKLSFRSRGCELRRRLLLPSSRRTRSLAGRALVEVAVDPASPRRVLVVALYE